MTAAVAGAVGVLRPADALVGRRGRAGPGRAAVRDDRLDGGHVLVGARRRPQPLVRRRGGPREPSPATPGCWRAAARPTSRRSAVAPAAQGRGRRDAPAALRSSTEAARRGATSLLLEVRADNAARDRLYRREGFERIAVRRRLLPARRRRRRGHATPPADRPAPRAAGGRRWLTSRSSSASRRRATRPASASSAGRAPARRRGGEPRRRSTPGSAASSRRSPAGRIWRRWCRRSSGPAARPASGSRDVDAVAVTAGPGLAGA